ncbi:hypothetical protein PF008_g15102 [Phytophthora fragariae]|uniref:PLAC8 family protein n=1 Tax=Phytophthora fragariae TaxID=53985 RepID=A0A6G0RFY4_9STRA|nr:hypothetical protein PF008_g15102 [Phytophthora fragariae]
MADTDQAYAIQIEDPKVTAPGITVGKWEVGFCGCFTDMVPNCLMVTFCPCVSLAQVLSRLGMMNFTTALILTLLLGVLAAFTGGLGYIVFAIWIWSARSKTRERFQIPGGSCDDYCAACCCGCCALAQIATHIKSYQPGSCGFGPQDMLPAYSRTYRRDTRLRLVVLASGNRWEEAESVILAIHYARSACSTWQSIRKRCYRWLRLVQRLTSYDPHGSARTQDHGGHHGPTDQAYAIQVEEFATKDGSDITVGK